MAGGQLFRSSCFVLIVLLFTTLWSTTEGFNTSTSNSSLFLALKLEAKVFPGRNSGFVRHSPLSRGDDIPPYLKLRSSVFLTKSALTAIYLILLAGDVSSNPGPVELCDRKSKLSCWSLNARSIVNKERELRTRLSSYEYDLIAVTETWLDSSISDAEIFPNSFQVIRRDRSRSGGGVLLACSQHLSVRRRHEFETDCEVLWCELVIPNPLTSLLVGVFYRPPSTDLSYLQELEKSLALIERNGNNLTIMLLGDFNLPNIDWFSPSPSCSDGISSYFCDIIDDNFSIK